MSVRHEIPGESFGYSLQLWRQGNQILGLLSALVGQAGDPPTGLLEDVKFDPQTGKLSFKARLSTAFVRDADNKYVRTREVFSFGGELSRNRVTGNLTISSSFPSLAPVSKKIVLRRSTDSTLSMEDGQTYEEWKADTDKILKRLGPKW